MEVIRTDIDGVLILEPRVFSDARGYFFESFAHGFAVLSESAVFQYKCDVPYHPEAESGIYPLDGSLGIDWGIPADKIILSDKDRNRASL